MIRLDERDIEILKILAREGRISKAELARRINLSPSPCWERLNRLRESGLIQGFRAEFSLTALRAMTIFVTVELESHRFEIFQRFERAMSRQEEIIACWALGGGQDYLLQIMAQDIERFQGLIDELLEAGLGIERYHSYVVTKAVKTSLIPPFESLLIRAEK